MPDDPAATHSPRELLAAVMTDVTDAPVFAVVVLNVVVLAYETQTVFYTRSLRIPEPLQDLELIFLALYTAEFAAKVYALSARVYFVRDRECNLEFLILALGIVHAILANALPDAQDVTELRILRGLRALRAFRAVSFLRTLKVVVKALLNTLRTNVLDIVVLLLLIMFIFAVLGHYLFATDPGTQSYQDWGTLGSALMTLFVFVCADGWLPYQQTLISDGFVGSQVFTAVFIFVGNFIIANMFVGVICQNIDDATKADLAEQQKKRREVKLMKRELFLLRQQKDISELLAQRGKCEEDNFQDLVKEMVGTLRHEDVVPMTHAHCNLTWIETFAVTLTHRENTLYRIQQLQFGIATCLAELMDQRLNSRMKQEQ
ncbi:Cation channel sperm-associated protein 3 [Entophlyctis sp. JEL0112]|nr:Cation channel sperm-associated protein 3 [Entophlyctis sp. JEL0112]